MTSVDHGREPCPHRILDDLGGAFAMSLNDVCCYVPVWFGCSATALHAHGLPSAPNVSYVRWQRGGARRSQILMVPSSDPL